MWMRCLCHVSHLSLLSRCRIDLERRAYRQRAGEGADEHHDHEARTASPGSSSTYFGKAAPDGGGDLADGKPITPSQRLLQDHARWCDCGYPISFSTAIS